MKEIFDRRSIRKYIDEAVSDEDLQKLLKAAMRAPSAGNEQPWEFVVLKERGNMLGIQKFHPYAGMLKQSAAVIVVCGSEERQKFPDAYWVQDCSAATQNILLEAQHLGLGAVWLGIYPLSDRVEGMKKLLDLPEHVTPLSAVSIGHPAESPEPIDSYDESRIHSEKW